jgi:hypothetical protein
MSLTGVTGITSRVQLRDIAQHQRTARRRLGRTVIRAAVLSS